jgi:hypothetical protein
MSNLVLPALSSTNQIAQAWPIKKTPSYKTIVLTPASNRGQNRVSLAPNPIWKFELDLSMMRGDLNQTTTTEIQALLDFYGAMLGAGGDFLYQDPYDNTATSQLIGYGDGTTASFQIGRSIGGLSFEMMQNVFPTAVTVGGVSVPAGPNPSGNQWYCGLENLLLQSSAFNLSPWLLGNTGASNPTVTANSTTAPDGTTTADTIAFPSTTGSHNSFIYQPVPTVQFNGQTFTFSVWLKVASGTASVGFQISDQVAQVQSTTVTVTTTWTRFSVTGTFNPVSGATASLIVLMSMANSAATNVFAWGAQLERWPSPTSYIATTTAAPVTPRGSLFFGSTGIPGANVPAFGAAIVVSYNYYYRCHFVEDEWSDLNEFLYQYWELPSLKFESLIL